MNPARSACVMRGHGPSSNATRAAATARAMSGAAASATLKKRCSVAESITSICSSDDGGTHAPPMKNCSGCRRGAGGSVVVVEVIWPPESCGIGGRSRLQAPLGRVRATSDCRRSTLIGDFRSSMSMVERVEGGS